MLYDLYNSERINQALLECAAWVVSLNRLKEESYYLKTRLSEALDNHAERELIAEAEDFQNLIVVRDEYIKEIATDAKNQEEKLKEALSKNNTAEKSWLKLQRKLRNEVAYLEKDFTKMKEDFNRKFFKNAAQ